MAKPIGDSAAQSGLGRSTLHGVLWMVSGAGTQSVLRLILMLTLARMLGPEVFGVIGAALVIVNLSQVLAELGIGSALVQRAQLEARHVQTAFTFLLILGAAVVALIQLLTPAIAGFFGFDDLAGVLHVLAVAPLITNTGVVAESLSRRALAFRRLALISVVSFVLGYGVVGLGLALTGAGVWALVTAYLVETASRSVMLLTIQPHTKRPLFEIEALRDLLSFGTGLTAWHLANALAQSVDNIVVGRWLGAEALGLYGRAYQLISAPAALFGKAIGSVLFPIMSRVQGERVRLAAAYRRSTAVLALITLPAATAVAILAPELIFVMLGPAWMEVVVPLQILAPGIFLRISFQLSGAVSAAAGAVYASAWRRGVYAFAVGAGALIGQQWSLPGVAAGVLAALLIHLFLSLQLTCRLTSISPADLALAHVRGVLFSGLVGCELGIVVMVLRTLQASPLLILGASMLVLAITALLVVRVRRAIGPDGAWLLENLAGRLPSRFSPHAGKAINADLPPI